ncbi:MAG: excalibur calcium-binding domain-containing protein [Arcanobacterium sp.]|nr:excalibur calcium-binding domain-containing protein [Arcanobacterium sp.]
MATVLSGCTQQTLPVDNTLPAPSLDTPQTLPPTQPSPAETNHSSTESPAAPAPQSLQETSPAPTPKPKPQQTPTPAPTKQAYYPNCKAAWDAGAAPIHAGEPGYSRKLDHNGDGVACEKRPRS